MNDRWETFLLGQGAQFEDGRVRGYGTSEPAAKEDEPDCFVADLSQYALLGISGDDAVSFLQGQLTCDIRLLDESRSLLGAYLSPKGRMLTSFRILRRNDALLMRLPASTLGPTMRRLQMFVLRAKVQLENLEPALVTLGVFGAAAPAALSSAIGGVPNDLNGVVRFGETTIVRVAGSVPRFEVFADPDTAIEIWRQLGATPVPADHWELLEIRSGLPTVSVENADAFVPQMANLEIVDGISFAKGCYTGQEVVARTQYLGRPKRRMYRAAVSGLVRPVAGSAIYENDGMKTSEVGRVVNSAITPEGDFELLAVLQTSAAGSGNSLRLGSPDGAELRLLELPYPLAN